MSGGQVGHRKTRNGKVIQLLHGNGCKKGGDNCFECKLPDCVYNRKTDKRIYEGDSEDKEIK